MLPDGRVRYRFKRAWRDGSVAVEFDPIDFVGKLAALVPRPHSNLVRYHGCLAPHASVPRSLANAEFADYITYGPPRCRLSAGSARQSRPREPPRLARVPEHCKTAAVKSATMSRSEKGRVAPAPLLRGVPQAVADDVAALPGVSVQAHWEIGSQHEVNGTDCYVGAEELGHIHLEGEAHIPVGPELVDALVGSRLARRFRWSKAFAAVDAHDHDLALWVFTLRRAQIGGALNDELLARIEARRQG